MAERKDTTQEEILRSSLEQKKEIIKQGIREKNMGATLDAMLGTLNELAKNNPKVAAALEKIGVLQMDEKEKFKSGKKAGEVRPNQEDNFSIPEGAEKVDAEEIGKVIGQIQAEAQEGGDDETLKAIEKLAKPLKGIDKNTDEDQKKFLMKLFGTPGDRRQAKQQALDAMKQLPLKLGGVIGEKIKGAFSAIKDGVGTFFDIIKTGLLLIGGLAALEQFAVGWTKATDWFGANATFGEKLASALAQIVGMFTGMTEGDTVETAENLAYYFGLVGDALSRILSAFSNIFGIAQGQEEKARGLIGSILDVGIVIGTLTMMFKTTRTLMLTSLLAGLKTLLITIGTTVITFLAPILATAAAALAPFLAMIAPFVIPIAILIAGIAMAFNKLRGELGEGASIMDTMKVAVAYMIDFLSMLVNVFTFIPRKVIGLLGPRVAKFLFGDDVDVSAIEKLSAGLRTDRGATAKAEMQAEIAARPKEVPLPEQNNVPGVDVVNPVDVDALTADINAQISGMNSNPENINIAAPVTTTTNVANNVTNVTLKTRPGYTHDFGVAYSY